MAPHSSQIAWRNGEVPVSNTFDDPYFSLEDGLAETRYVFLQGNDLPGRFTDGFHIAELGFGMGLNLLATLDLWRRAEIPGVLHFTSFEAFPLSPDEMIRAQTAFPELADLAAEFAPLWKGLPKVSLPDLSFELIIGDARNTVPAWSAKADAWFLDGFAPAKNPELWEEDLLQAAYNHTNTYGTAATYTAAGYIRRRMETVGFSVERLPGFGRKRHMTQARKTRR